MDNDRARYVDLAADVSGHILDDPAVKQYWDRFRTNLVRTKLARSVDLPQVDHPPAFDLHFTVVEQALLDYAESEAGIDYLTKAEKAGEIEMDKLAKEVHRWIENGIVVMLARPQAMLRHATAEDILWLVETWSVGAQHIQTLVFNTCRSWQRLHEK